jgi:opacity protein-like surface antigen
MFRKIIIIIHLFLLCFITTAFAYTDPSGNSNETLAKFKPSTVLAEPKDVGSYIDTQKYPEEKEINPFYIGISGGLDIGSIKNYRSDTKLDQRLGSLGPYGTVTLGYGGKFNAWYLGATIDGSLSWTQYKCSYSNAYRKIEMPYTFGAYFVPGFFVAKHTLLYTRLGAVNSKFKTSINDSLFNAESFSTNIWGGRLSLGVRYYFNKYFSINGEYVFTYYQDAKDTYQGNETTYSPLTNQFNLGIAVHF